MTIHAPLDARRPDPTLPDLSATGPTEPATGDGGDTASARQADRTGSLSRAVRRLIFVAADGLAAAVATAVCGGTAAGGVAFVAAVILIDLADRRGVHRLTLYALDDVRALALRGVVVTGAATVLGLPMAGSGMPGGPQNAAWLFTAVTFVLLAALGRSMGYAALRRSHTAGRLVSSAIVVGAGATGRRIVGRLQDHPEYGIVPLGYADNMARPPDVPSSLLLGDVSDLPKLIVRYGVHHVFVAFGRMRDIDMVDLLRACDGLDCEIFVVPRLFELGVGASSADHL